ncbi:MAG: ABC transporter permease [Acidimicrobiales bacterium]
MNTSMRRLGLALAAPGIAFVFAVIVSSIVLQVSGSSPIDTFKTMIDNGTQLEVIIDTLNRATPLFIGGIAAAIGFRMNLFNIGVEGQYFLAAFAAAVVGAELALPGPLHIGVMLFVAMAVGAAWAGLAAVLKVYRGVNEVIATIMLNFLAIGGLIAAIFPSVIDMSSGQATNAGTKQIPESGWIPDLNGFVEIFTRDIGKGRELTGVLVVAIVVGVAYSVMVNRTVFGFDLRASGMNPFAARVGGVPPGRMIIIAMLLSGAVAGLIGMPEILSDNHSYDQGFVRGLGFEGLGIALLGRKTSPGIMFAALLFGFLDSSSAVLQVSGSASQSIVVIMKATILLAAVVAYEVVDQYRQRDEVKRAALATGAAA